MTDQPIERGTAMAPVVPGAAVAPTAPIVVPIATERTATMSAICSVVRIPYSTRLKMSRPSTSVPKTCDPVGPCSVCRKSCFAYGNGATQLATAPTTKIPISRKRLPIASRWRRNLLRAYDHWLRTATSRPCS